MSVQLGAHQDNRAQLDDCNIQPVVIVFDSKSGHRHKPRRKSKKPKSTACPQKFAFINVSQPDGEDEDSRRLIRTHVMQNVLQRAERQKAESNKGMEIKASILGDKTSKPICPRPEFCLMENSPRAPPSNLVTFPVHIQPYMLKSIHDYATLMLRTNAKVTDSAWFPFIMTDAALFHALLCLSTLVVNVISDIPSNNSLLENSSMLKSIRLISARLLDKEAISDGTIATILFMAKSEYFQQNYDTWSIHMDGVRKMVNLRGGIRKLSDLIQLKIYTIDLLGCIETGTMPHFPFIDVTNPMSPLHILDLPPMVVTLAEVYRINQGLLNLLRQIPAYTASQVPIEEMPSLHYRLLSIYPEIWQAIPARHLRRGSHCYSLRLQQQIIEELLVVGSLLYLSLPHLQTALHSFRPINYEYLVNRSEICAAMLVDNNSLYQDSILLLWLLFLCEIHSSAHTSSTFKSRAKLRAVMSAAGITAWDDMRLALGALWWIEPIYDRPYHLLWEEIYMIPHS